MDNCYDDITGNLEQVILTKRALVNRGLEHHKPGLENAERALEKYESLIRDNPAFAKSEKTLH